MVNVRDCSDVVDVIFEAKLLWLCDLERHVSKESLALESSLLHLEEVALGDVGSPSR